MSVLKCLFLIDYPNLSTHHCFRCLLLHFNVLAPCQNRRQHVFNNQIHTDSYLNFLLIQNTSGIIKLSHHERKLYDVISAII